MAKKTEAKSWTTASGRTITESDAAELAAEVEADDSVWVVLTSCSRAEPVGRH